jgi:hypothetical protein
MNNRLNYSGFIEMFLESNDEFEPYGVITESLEQFEPQACTASAEKYVISQTVLRTLD